MTQIQSKLVFLAFLLFVTGCSTDGTTAAQLDTAGAKVEALENDPGTPPEKLAAARSKLALIAVEGICTGLTTACGDLRGSCGWCEARSTSCKKVCKDKKDVCRAADDCRRELKLMKAR